MGRDPKPRRLSGTIHRLARVRNRNIVHRVVGTSGIRQLHLLSILGDQDVL